MRTPTSHQIRDIVCKYYRIAPAQFRSPRRGGVLCECRRMIVFLCCTMTGETYKSIAAAVLRDHSTVIHHEKWVYKLLMDGNQKTAELVALLKGRIREELECAAGAATIRNEGVGDAVSNCRELARAD